LSNSSPNARLSPEALAITFAECTVKEVPVSVKQELQILKGRIEELKVIPVEKDRVFVNEYI
jgi:hypothetical protein